MNITTIFNSSYGVSCLDDSWGKKGELFVIFPEIFSEKKNFLMLEDKERLTSPVSSLV